MRNQHIPGEPTRASIAVGVLITLALTSTTVTALTTEGRLRAASAGVLGGFAVVMMAGQTVGQVLRRRYGKEIAEQRAAARLIKPFTDARIDCPYPGCDGATTSQAAMDMHLRVWHRTS